MITPMWLSCWILKIDHDGASCLWYNNSIVGMILAFKIYHNGALYLQ